MAVLSVSLLVSLLAKLLNVMAAGLAVLLLSAAAVYWLFLRPPVEPRGIPAAPFWLALLPLVRDIDQAALYAAYLREPLLRHGAIKLFFGARWNVIVQRPAWLADVFRHEDGAFEKSGNHEKIPHSVLAAFLGENIISARGDVWRHFRGVVQPGLKVTPALAAQLPLAANAQRLVALLLEAQAAAGPGRGILVQALLQRYTIANTATALGIGDFGTLDSENAPLHRLQSAVKQAIFQPIFMNFPFLDRLPLPSRQQARDLSRHFTDTLIRRAEQTLAETDQHCESKESPLHAAVAPRLLQAQKAGVLTERQLRDNLTVAFVAGQENPQLLLTSTLYLLGKQADVQERLRREVTLWAQSIDADAPDHAETLARLPFLTAVLYESLRLYPPSSQLVNRRTATDLQLGDGQVGIIPQGTYVGYHCYATNRDPTVWGADADAFRPERWFKGAAGCTTPTCRIDNVNIIDHTNTIDAIQQKYRRHRARAEFASFHGGRRACLGEQLALLEMRTTLAELVQAVEWQLDPEWPEKMTPAGPLYPRALRLVVKERQV